MQPHLDDHENPPLSKAKLSPAWMAPSVSALSAYSVLDVFSFLARQTALFFNELFCPDFLTPDHLSFTPNCISSWSIVTFEGETRDTPVTRLLTS